MDEKERRKNIRRTTIILALDISRSMCAIDVPPNRLTVAQDAALAFIEAPGTIDISDRTVLVGVDEVTVAGSHSGNVNRNPKSHRVHVCV